MKRLLKLTLVTLFGVLFQEVAAQQPVLSDSVIAKIGRFLNEAVDEEEIPAVEAIVIGKNEVLYHNVFGIRNAQDNLEKRDLFDIASMTKPVTAVAVMILYEEGKLDLDDPASIYLPWLKELEVITSFNKEDTTYSSTSPKNPVTVRQLLSHTSGMGYTFLHEPLQMLAEKQGDTGLLYDYTQFPLLYEPGTGWSYGISARVLGELVEKVSGQPLDEFFKQRIFIPLNMTNTFYKVPEDKLDRRVNLQIRESDGWVEQAVPARQEPVIIGDAALISTALDYARFLQMMLNRGTLDGNRILSERSVELMTQNQIGELVIQELFNGFPTGAGRDTFGYGFRIASQDPGNSGLRSTGSYSWAGSNNTFFWVDPKQEVAVILLMQYSPFFDAQAQAVIEGFERRIYKGWK